MTPPAAKAPLAELGAVTQGQLKGMPSWLVQGGGTDTDHVPELLWPQNLDIYAEMAKSPAIKHHIRAVELAVLGMRWWIDPRDADPRLAERMAADLGLAVGEKGDPPRGRRTKGRFIFGEHARLALDAPLRFGHSVFEQVAKVDDDGWVRVHKLAPRPQNTIAGWLVAEDGGLVAVQQHPPGKGQIVEIPVDRVVVYVHDQRPGVWTGEPIIRSCFQSWYLRDKVLVRLDATKHDRNSMGVPVATPRDGATPTRTQRENALAQMAAVRAGDEAGLVADEVYEFAMQGVTGATSDPIESVKYHDQQISKQFLGMVFDTVSSETGNRSVAGTVDEKWAAGVQSLAEGLRDTFQAHVLEDAVDWQGNPDAPVPTLEFTAGDPEATAASLAEAVSAGLIQVDDELEDWARERLKVPARTTPRQTFQPPTPPEGGSESEGESPEGVQAAAAAPGDPSAFRREPTDVEVQAAVDWPALSQRWRLEARKLADKVAAERITVGQRLAAQIADLLAAGDTEAVEALVPPAVGAVLMDAAFKKAVAAGADDVRGEAKRQGVKAVKAAKLAEAESTASKLAAATAGLIGSELKAAVVSKAIAVTATGTSPGTIAAAASAHVASLSDASVVSRVGAGVVSSTGEGRVAQIRDTSEATPVRVQASELMDSATCSECASVDGREYDTLDDALVDYPNGAQYADCEGGPACRGLLIAIWDESAPTLQEPGA